MTLMEKYKDALQLGPKLGMKDLEVWEEGGKLHLKGTTEYQLEKDLIWDKIKSCAGWESELAANISVEKTDIHGIHTVVSGDSLSKIARLHLDDAKRYQEIFELNRDQLQNPDLIQVGQKLKIPRK